MKRFANTLILFESISIQVYLIFGKKFSIEMICKHFSSYIRRLWNKIIITHWQALSDADSSDLLCSEHWCNSHASPKHILYNGSLRSQKKKNSFLKNESFFQISIIWKNEIKIRCPIPLAITGKPRISGNKQNFLKKSGVSEYNKII